MLGTFFLVSLVFCSRFPFREVPSAVAAESQLCGTNGMPETWYLGNMQTFAATTTTAMETRIGM